jgi:glycerol-3-phosphate dehydrogenase
MLILTFPTDRVCFLQKPLAKEETVVLAQVLVNASGMWIEEVLVFVLLLALKVTVTTAQEAVNVLRL